MQRLVTQSDLLEHPELAKKGVSVNQLYDFDADPTLYKTLPAKPKKTVKEPDKKTEEKSDGKKK